MGLEALTGLKLACHLKQQVSTSSAAGRITMNFSKKQIYNCSLNSLNMRESMQWEGDWDTTSQRADLALSYAEINAAGNSLDVGFGGK